ncbi:glycerol-3-phosphate cytidylyltransferase [Vibrio algivorus]|uniref:Glycerol-3-phosphate cytidylyltransferase n=1 Tax=Vibrio algivorus TaxID=1667024 RepID=A0A557P5L1_9VIBR|nr:glycerol-3-phosphate cytidylyltransferase [Vibrio algivorus]TVO35952.1 glycerol-3-phosphate cytidylyltransferase [Vibrio algivorus]
MKTIITYGTFDLFHVGHVNLLKKLSLLGDKLIVAVSTDEFNHLKGKKSIFSYDERFEILSSCKYVDLVIPEKSWEQKISDIKKYNVKTFAIGDDWRGKFDHLNDFCDVLYLPRTESISTTDVRNTILNIKKEELEKLKGTIIESIDIIESIQSSLR